MGTGDKLKILWHAAPPWVTTGYGLISRHITSRLDDVELAWVPTVGTGGARWDWNGIPIYPIIDLKVMGEDIIERWARDFGADIVISVTDHWIWKTDVWSKFRWVPIAFPDTEPVGQKLVENLKMAHKAVVPTRWGTDVLKKAGVKAEYIPLGVDTSVYYPDRSARAQQRAILIGAARKQGAPYLTEECFVFGMVARNGTYPFRKGHDLAMDATAQLLKRGHKDFLVYMHSMADTTHAGVDLIKMVAAYSRAYKDERVARHIMFPPPEQMHLGAYHFDDDRMRALYNSMDCLLNPSQWEGFGLPLIEAAACGVPSITTDSGCQPEIGPVGWKIPVYRRFYAAATDTFIAEPDLGGLVNTMEAAMRHGRNEEMKEKAVRHAQDYDWDKIVDEYWNPLLDGIRTGLGAERKGLVAVGG